MTASVVFRRLQHSHRFFTIRPKWSKLPEVRELCANYGEATDVQYVDSDEPRTLKQHTVETFQDKVRSSPDTEWMRGEAEVKAT